MSELAKGHSKRRHHSQNRSVNTAAERPNALWPLAGLCLIAALWLLPEAWRQLRAYLATGPARAAITRIGTPHPLTTTDEWNEVLAALERAIAIAPDDSATQLDLGALYGSASLRPEIGAELRVEYALNARLHDQVATRSRPTEPRGWAELARAELLTGNAGRAYIQAWEIAAALGSGEAMVQSQLLELLFATYPDPHTRAMAEWLHQVHTTANPDKRKTLQRLAQGFELSISLSGQLAPLSAGSPVNVPAPAAVEQGS